GGEAGPARAAYRGRPPANGGGDVQDRAEARRLRGRDRRARALERQRQALDEQELRAAGLAQEARRRDDRQLALDERRLGRRGAGPEVDRVERERGRAQLGQRARERLAADGREQRIARVG